MTNVAECLINLVAIDSPTGDEDRFGEYLISLLAPLVTLVQQDAFGNIYARRDGSGDPIFFAAHLDTVEPGRGINAETLDGFVVSDGSTILGADNKAAIAIYLSLLDLLHESGSTHRPIEFIFTRSEEIGNFGAIHFDYSLLRAKMGYCFDSVAPVGTIITASPFYERIDITLTGKEAHASKPEEARSVLPLFASLLQQLPVGRINDTTLCNIGVVHSGSGRNTIPGSGTLQLEMRSFVEGDLLGQLEQLYSIVDELRLVFGNAYTIDVTSERENPGYYHRSGAVRNIISSIEHAMNMVGMTPHQVDSMAVSDANIFNTHGLLCVNLGDGVEFAHSVRERVKVSDLDKLVELCKQLIL